MKDTSDWVKHWRSSKTYTATAGLTCCFRQWRAESHCRFLHGYPIQVHFEFATEELDERNWVVDFGSLKSLKGWLEDTFDHKTIVAEDDPMISEFRRMHDREIINMVVLPSCGMEKFAEFIYEYAESWLHDNGYTPRCRLVGVDVSEHDGNGATFYKTPPRKKSLSYEIALESHEQALREMAQADRTKGFGHIEQADYSGIEQRIVDHMINDTPANPDINTGRIKGDE